MMKIGFVVGILLIAFAIIVGMPIALIWAINTLFPSVAIPYTLETWLAAFIIPAAFKTEIKFGNKDK